MIKKNTHIKKIIQSETKKKLCNLTNGTTLDFKSFTEEFKTMKITISKNVTIVDIFNDIDEILTYFNVTSTLSDTWFESRYIEILNKYYILSLKKSFNEEFVILPQASFKQDLCRVDFSYFVSRSYLLTENLLLKEEEEEIEKENSVKLKKILKKLGQLKDDTSRRTKVEKELEKKSEENPKR